MAMDQLGVFWTPAGFNIPDIGTKALVDVSDGDTPTIQMPIRMLSVDTPEVTARSEAAAQRIDAEFGELAGWIEAGLAPVSADFALYIIPKLKTGTAGTLQLALGKQAGQWFRAEIDRRLLRTDGSRRKLFVRISEAPFDNYGRLLAYISPQYSTDELARMSRADRATFNMGLVESGWAASFILFPNVPGELDLPLFVDRADTAYSQKRGQWADPVCMPGYEYRMCEKLHDITKKLVGGEQLKFADRLAWRSRYCADIRSRELYGPEQYMKVPPPYRMWIWPQDTQAAVGKLNFVPHGSLVSLSS